MPDILERYYYKFTSFINNTGKKIPNNLITAIFVVIPSSLYLIRGWQYIKVPQLYAEDGSVWLANAYNNGAKSIFTPYAGFTHSAERIFAYLVSLLPLQIAPLLFNMAGFGLFILMCYYLFSFRTKIFTNNYQKIFMALSLGLIANFNEFIFNFSNSVFLLGIIGLSIYLARPSKNKLVNLTEKLLFVLACLTLPFAWLYILIIGFEWFIRKKYNLFFIITSVIGSIIQLLVHLFSVYPRPSIPLTTIALSRYTIIEIYNQIITPAFRHARIDISPTISDRQLLVLFIFCLLLALTTIIILIKNASLKIQYIAAFLLLFTGASLVGPITEGLSPAAALKFMSTATYGNRYFFYGVLFMTILTAIATDIYIKKSAKYLFLILFMVFSIFSALQYNNLGVNKNFYNYSSIYQKDIIKLNQSKPHTLIKIPENPGNTWFIDLNSKK